MKKALLCLFAALSMQVAAQDFSYQSVVYTITDADAGTCQTRAGFYDTVNHKDHWSGNPDHSGQLVIPATASDGDKEYTVTALGDVSFRSSSGLTSVVLPNTVKTIGNFCFDDCPSLSSVKLPESLTEIGMVAFWGCTSLTELTIPPSVTRIGELAFDRCIALKSLTLESITPPEVYDNTFSSYSVKLYVPDQSLTAYRSHPVWGRFRISAIGQDTPDITPEGGQLTSLPTLFINTANRQPVQSKDVYTPATITVLSQDPAQAMENVTLGIRGRGNGTWLWPKKPYRLKFDQKCHFLNQPAKAKSWTLLANMIDKTLIRNALAYELAQFMDMEFAPAAVPVDVVLNGEYIGNFLASDQVERDSKRINVEKQTVDDVEVPAITGGYLFAIDGYAPADPVHFETDLQKMPVTVKYPDDDKINKEQINYLTDHLNGLEEKLFGPDFTDPDNGWRSVIDSRSMIDYFLGTEICGNGDGWWTTYMYKRRGNPLIYVGPMWDFDMAFNNDYRFEDATHMLAFNSMHGYRQWILRLWEDPAFRAEANLRWCQLLDAGLLPWMQNRVDELAQMMQQSQEMNYDVWDIEQKLGGQRLSFSTYDEYVADLKEYIDNRIEFLAQWFNMADDTLYPLEVNATSTYRLQHSQGNFMGEDPVRANRRVFLVTEDEAPELKFVAAESGWNIQLPSGRWVTNDGGQAMVSSSRPAGLNGRFEFYTKADGSTLLIKNLATGQYVGCGHSAPTSRIWTDRDGHDAMHFWTLHETPGEDIEDGITRPDADTRLTYDGRCVRAYGSAISIIDVNGATVASGRNTVATRGLAPGVYIAITPAASLKLVVR